MRITVACRTRWPHSLLIGDINDFAIEVMVEPDLMVPSSVWGRMCVHIGDTTLGETSTLFTAEQCK
jgi:hypothetical protein